MGCNKHKKVGEWQYNASYKSTLDWLSIYYNYSTWQLKVMTFMIASQYKINIKYENMAWSKRFIPKLSADTLQGTSSEWSRDTTELDYI